MAKRGINKVTIMGALGQDPETRYLQNGDAVTTMSVCTSESWKDKTGAKQESKEWHRVVVWRKLAEIAGEYCRKGKRVYVEGKLSTRKWQDKDGVERYTTEIIADELIKASRTPTRPAMRRSGQHNAHRQVVISLMTSPSPA